MFCLQFIWIFLFVLLSVLGTWTKLYMFIWSQQRHNFRLFKICRCFFGVLAVCADTTRCLPWGIRVSGDRENPNLSLWWHHLRTKWKKKKQRAGKREDSGCLLISCQLRFGHALVIFLLQSPFENTLCCLASGRHVSKEESHYSSYRRPKPTEVS